MVSCSNTDLQSQGRETGIAKKRNKTEGRKKKETERGGGGGVSENHARSDSAASNNKNDMKLSRMIIQFS